MSARVNDLRETKDSRLDIDSERDESTIESDRIRVESHNSSLPVTIKCTLVSERSKTVLTRSHVSALCENGRTQL